MEEQILQIGVNEHILVVNDKNTDSKLAAFNHFYNTFSIFLHNNSEEYTLVFCNPAKITREKYIEKGGNASDILLDGVDFIFSTDFAARSECGKFKFRADGWTAGEGDSDDEEQEYVWSLMPKTTVTLKPGQQIQFQVYDVESFAYEPQGETTCNMKIYIYCTEEEKKWLRKRETLGDGSSSVPFQKVKKVEILDFFSDYGAVQAGGTENIQWNITGASKGILRNEQTGEKISLDTLESPVITQKIEDTTTFTLEIEDDKGEKDSRSICIRTSPPKIKKWCLNREVKEPKVEWEVHCIEKLQFKDFPIKDQKEKEGVQGVNRGNLFLSQIGETDRIIMFGENTGRDFISTLWIPNGKEVSEEQKKGWEAILQFRKTLTCFDGYQLLEVVWELEQGKNMILACHDLERGQFWNIAVNQTKGTWEQVLPKSQPTVEKDTMEIRLQCENYEVIF